MNARRPRPGLRWALVGLFLLFCSGCSLKGGSLAPKSSQGLNTAHTAPPSARSPAGRAPSFSGRFLKTSPATQTATLTLIAGMGSVNGGYSFDGTWGGAMVLTVPVGWKVVVDFENAGSVPSTAAVVSPGSLVPAFPGATLGHVAAGLPVGASGSFSFVAAAAGTYRIVDPLPGRQLAGMWAQLVVAPQGTPSLNVGAPSGPGNAPSGP